MALNILAMANIFYVKKKDGGLHPCVDYKGLNTPLVKYLCLLPLIPAALGQLTGTWYFTKWHLCNTYNLIHMREGDDWKTVFSTVPGHYKYLAISYDLSTIHKPMARQRWSTKPCVGIQSTCDLSFPSSADTQVLVPRQPVSLGRNTWSSTGHHRHRQAEGRGITRLIMGGHKGQKCRPP
ncbi:hypothetical protein P4O66_014812 [Electrophorus voltai]|uniref:Uncharacterized protein n=1 Tax=Electrophorus voltai TaxID=2609070 RepID=A0AAD8Z0W1_9TELE|nr:hypothetical protein P4O66_014812 [Electrophorus voltai]